MAVIPIDSFTLSQSWFWLDWVEHPTYNPSVNRLYAVGGPATIALNITNGLSWQIGTSFEVQINWHDGGGGTGDNITGRIPVQWSPTTYTFAPITHRYVVPGVAVGSYVWMAVEIWMYRTPGSLRTRSYFRHFQLWNGLPHGAQAPDLTANERSSDGHFFLAER